MNRFEQLKRKYDKDRTSMTEQEHDEYVEWCHKFSDNGW